MSADTVLPTRLRAGAPGLGQGSQIEIEQRAAELAMSDGRELISDADLAMAQPNSPEAAPPRRHRRPMKCWSR
ncbi:MAG: hypothetical protein IAE77_26595 [Prosthecobacter sp.]|jgi:hypothetical protein|uniref:hypothetical protein n=1 Tax=Prosthecobacter sp. TaxID=1965333 RepID=UPI001A0F1DCA|nr:hypothetical protein [Prosthecobacter sp.]MBE2287054.1 hypothetical protein [Prosthecobacter sp.]